MKYAIIEDNIVQNITMASSPLAENWVSLQGITPEPGIGWSYNGSVFTSPAPITTTYYSLPLKSFWKRFTQAERETLQNILATGTQNQKNKLNAFRDYLTTGMNVELVDDYIISSITLMETVGILAVGRANSILNTPIISSEL